MTAARPELQEIAAYHYKTRTEGRIIVLQGIALRCVGCERIFLTKKKAEKHVCGISPHKLDK